MAFTFEQLQSEVLRRSIRNQAGTTFTTAVKNLINSSIFRISREAPWRPMRRRSSFSTVTSYIKGTTAAVTSNSNIATISGATLYTDDVEIGRRIKFDTSSTYYYINTITSETALTVSPDYSGVTSTATNYSILPQEEYNLPIQAGHRVFLWHEDFGFPFLMRYIPDQTFYELAYYLTIINVPTHYRMWGEDMVISQVKTPSVMSLSSSSSADTSISVTVFGNVNGYPDYEVITTNGLDGTTAVTGSNLFQSVERVVKSASTSGLLTITANSGNTTISKIPRGDTTSGIVYRKVKLYPLPRRAFTMFVQYYKDPYRLVNNGDVHELGQDFDEAIILLSVAKMKAEENQSESDRFMALFKDEMAVLRRTNCDKIDWFPKLKHPWMSNSALLVHPNLLYGQVGANFGPASRR